MIDRQLPGWILVGLLAPLLAFVVSCEGGEPNSETGLHPDFPYLQMFMVDTVPTRTIGLDPPGEQYVFVSVTGGGIVGDSLIVVVDSRLKRVGVYGFDGRFRRWIIEEGQGPGEVESIYRSGVLADGRVWVYDRQNLRLLAVDLGGQLLSEAEIPSQRLGNVLRLDPIGPGAEGSWWLKKTTGAAGSEPGALFRVPTDLLRLDRNGKVDTVWSGGGDLGIVVDAREAVLEGTPATDVFIRRPSHFPRLRLNASGHGVLMARSDSGWVDHLTVEHGRRRIGEIPLTRVPVPPEDPPPNSGPTVEALYRQGLYYDEINQILTDPEGGVWIYQPARVEESRASGEPVMLYRLSGGEPMQAIISPFPWIAPLVTREWVLVERRHPETSEQYVSLHRLVPVEGTEQ